MLNKVECKNCQAAEEAIAIEDGESFYICHRRSGPQAVPMDYWCYDGIYRYGDKDED